MMGSEPTVFVVDDNEPVRRFLVTLAARADLPAEGFNSAQDFLQRYDPARPGCLVLDVRMPGMSGLELQEKLKAEGIEIPIIFVTGHADVPMAVKAVQNGAVDFLQKPIEPESFMGRLHEAIARDTCQRKVLSTRKSIRKRLRLLTSREREVLHLVVAGKANKEMATELRVGVKAIEAHRARIMRKMEAGSLPELVRMVAAVEPEPV